MYEIAAPGWDHKYIAIPVPKGEFRFLSCVPVNHEICREYFPDALTKLAEWNRLGMFLSQR